jgi:hypothetical protein
MRAIPENLNWLPFISQNTRPYVHTCTRRSLSWGHYVREHTLTSRSENRFLPHHITKHQQQEIFFVRSCAFSFCFFIIFPSSSSRSCRCCCCCGCAQPFSPRDESEQRAMGEEGYEMCGKVYFSFSVGALSLSTLGWLRMRSLCEWNKWLKKHTTLNAIPILFLRGFLRCCFIYCYSTEKKENCFFCLECSGVFVCSRFRPSVLLLLPISRRVMRFLPACLLATL